MNKTIIPPPYFRLSGFYFFYFAFLGALIPYWGLYLEGQGFNAASIGQLTAIVLGTKVVSPLIWSWVARHSVSNMFIVRLGAMATLIFVRRLFSTFILAISSLYLRLQFFQKCDFT